MALDRLAILADQRVREAAQQSADRPGGARSAAQFSINANLFIDVCRPDWSVAQHMRTKNLFVRSGRNQLRDLILFPDELFSHAFTPNYIEISSNGTTTTDTMVALVDQPPALRKLITRRIPLNSGCILQLYVLTSEANGRDLREAGIFSTAAGGQLWARGTHNLIVKTSAIAIIYTWTLTIASS